MDIDGFPKISSFLQVKDIPLPHLIFDPLLLDSKFTKETGLVCPLRESRKDGQYLTGCYAWIEDGEEDEQPEIMYVGKAARLRNRLGSHWLSSEGFLLEWADEREEAGRDWRCCVAVWFSDNRAALESELIRKLSPKFNKREE